MKQKYCLQSINHFSTINRASTNRSKTKQTFSFCRSSRFQTIQPNCPINTYDKGLPHRKMGATIDQAKKVGFTHNTSISPGTKYYVGSTFENNKQKHKGYTLTLEREKIAYDSYINPHTIRLPGVGRYHLETETAVKKSREPVYSMRRRTKMVDRTMTIQPQNNNPSPAHYDNNPEQAKSSFSSSFKRLSYSGSKSKRFLNPNNKVPGPGQYDNATNLSNVGKYVISSHQGGTRAKFDHSKRVTKFDEAQRSSNEIPGPGSYRQSSQFGQYDGDVYSTIRRSAKRLLHQK